ncbi:MAG: hypothetical protein R3F16_17020 [Myxococcota bacterium]
MGAILRSTIERSKSDPDFMRLLEEKYALSRETSIFDCVDTTDELTRRCAGIYRASSASSVARRAASSRRS